MGTVEEIAYDATDGFVLVVKMQQGAHVREDIVCELGQGLAPAGGLLSLPFRVGDFAVCVVPEGDANAGPVVLGFLRTDDRPAPSTVNGQAITLALLEQTYVLVDTRALELELGPVRLVAPKIQLGPTPEPTQPFVRGQALAEALGTFLSTVGGAAFGTSQACVGPLAPLKAFFETLSTSCDTLKSKLVAGVVLSTTITGE
jgi:hypothetical protein